MSSRMYFSQKSFSCRSARSRCHCIDSCGKVQTLNRSTDFKQASFLTISKFSTLNTSKSPYFYHISAMAALKMIPSLESAKMPRSHGIALLRVTLFFSSILLVLCMHTEMLAKGQLVHDCKSTPSLRNGKLFYRIFLNCIFTFLLARSHLLLIFSAIKQLSFKKYLLT